MRPRPPLTPRLLKSSRITSFGVTQSEKLPVSSTPTTSGAGIWKGCPAITRATSRPPAPMAMDPRAPEEVVCESAPTSVAPGLAKRLIYPQPPLLAGAELPFDHVGLEDPGDQILRHCPSPRFPELAYVFYR